MLLLLELDPLLVLEDPLLLLPEDPLLLLEDPLLPCVGITLGVWIMATVGATDSAGTVILVKVGGAA